MSDEKKIIIDEDWKSQVAAEKEAAARKARAEAPTGPAPQQPAASAAETPGGAGPPLPPASFEMLVTMLASEAMIGLGQIPNPLSGKAQRDLAQAHYSIDMLEMLAEKTRGNLTPNEDRGMRDLLYQLRLAYVEAGK